jgi:putative DNA primase/helicase
MNMKINTKTIKDLAAGWWSDILRYFVPHLEDIIQRGRRHGPCPLCGGKDRARCHNDFAETGGIICNQCGGAADGLGVLMWANKWTFPETLKEVEKYLGLNNGIVSTLHQSISPPQPKKDWRKEQRKVMAIWEAATPNHSRLNEYLKCRGLSSDQPETLRLHHSLEYWYDGKSYGKFPCMVARIIKNDELTGIHRTFLNLDTPGKAPVPKPKLSKKCTDSMTGGCIPLFEFDQEKPLVLCEGTETALAVRQMTDYPVWACVSSKMMEKVALPNNIKSVIIAADKDKSGAGEESAKRLAQRLVGEGREVKISLPPMEIPEGEKTVDWLDYLNSKEINHV